MDIITGIAIILILFFSTSMIERNQRAVKQQNETIIALLKEMNQKMK
ncbi:MAG: hypothetical protein ACRC5C_04095 [Bacilli bacterium]